MLQNIFVLNCRFHFMHRTVQGYTQGTNSIKLTIVTYPPSTSLNEIGPLHLF